MFRSRRPKNEQSLFIIPKIIQPSESRKPLFLDEITIHEITIQLFEARYDPFQPNDLFLYPLILTLELEHWAKMG